MLADDHDRKAAPANQAQPKARERRASCKILNAPDLHVLLHLQVLPFPLESFAPSSDSYLRVPLKVALSSLSAVF